jgi:hypothetical protein
MIFIIRLLLTDAGWSSLVARWAHNPKVAGSNPAPATNLLKPSFSSLTSFLDLVYTLSRFVEFNPCTAL